MASKRSKLLDRVEETRRLPQPKRILEDDGSVRPRKKGYAVVAVSLYNPEVGWLDEISKQLQRSGIVKANRSLVVREAIAALQHQLAGKGAEEVLRFFIDRQATRAAR